jgi:hypothetical protein
MKPPALTPAAATNEQTAPPATQTIVFVGGDKGGVGKSTVARTLLEFYQQEKVPFIAFDGDDTNPTLTRFFKTAERLSSKTPKGFEPLINNLEGPEGREGVQRPLQLVDLGAGTSIVLNQFVEQTGFFEVAKAQGAKVTFVFVLAPSADSINLLKILSEQHGRRLAYVIVRNNANPGTWDLWEGSKTRAWVLSALDGIELEIPILDAEAFAQVDRKGVSWREALLSKEVKLVARSYIFRWRQKVYAEFEKAKGLLV